MSDYRKIGNDIIKSLNIHEELMDFKVKIFKAISYYSKASSSPNSDVNNYIACQKNIIVANIKLFLKGIRDLPILNNFDFIIYHFKYLINEYIAFINKTHSYLPKDMIYSHINQLHKIKCIFFTFFKEHLDSFENKISFLNNMSLKIPMEYINLTYLVKREVSLMYFHEGIKKFEDKNFKYAKTQFYNSLEISKEILFKLSNESKITNKTDFLKGIYEVAVLDQYNYADLEELISYENLNHSEGYQEKLFKKSLESQLNQLITDNETYLLKCDILMKIEYGDKLYSEAIFEDDEIDMEKVFDVLETYRDAHQLISTVLNSFSNNYTIDIELEAIITSKLGYIIFRVFKHYEKAKEFLTHSCSLGMSLYPKNIQSERWYVKASTSLQEIRKLLIKVETEEDEKIRNQYLIELKDELDKLRKASEILSNSSDKANLKIFLDYLIENHKAEKKTIIQYEEAILDNKKKILQKFIMYYHPDKNKDESIKKQVELSEVSKVLNNIYNQIKG